MTRCMVHGCEITTGGCPRCTPCISVNMAQGYKDEIVRLAQEIVTAAYMMVNEEVSRLRRQEEAAKEWANVKPSQMPEGLAFDYAAVARAILEGKGPTQ